LPNPKPNWSTHSCTTADGKTQIYHMLIDGK
jgi:hypothetical protein